MSAVNDLSRDATLVLGGGSAILLQVADPVVAAAVARYSNFAHRPLSRLDNTLTFVYATVLGTPAQRELVARYTRRAHAGIPQANDPEHQLWVAATLYRTAVQVYERVRAPLAPDVAQEVLTRYAVLGTALEVPLSLWPATTADFDAYWADAVAGLDVGDDARQVAHDLFHPVTVPWWARLALPVVALLTADLLGAELRDAFRMPWGRGRARRAAAAWGVVRVLVRILPARVRSAPSRRYLRRLDRLASRAS